MSIRHRKKKAEGQYERLLAQETLIVEVTEEICRVLDEQDVTRNELAQRLGKSKGFITQVLSGERNMTLRTMADFAAALGCRFRVQATSPMDETHGHPLYFRLRGLEQQGGLRLGISEGAFGVFAREWSQTLKDQPRVPNVEGTRGMERWSPATQGFECGEGEAEGSPDHEFSLTA
jgi:transcriptional regulator with XRE-family HTH domain